MPDSQKPSIHALDRIFAKGVAWTAAGKWATQLVTWGSVVIVARLLSPAELGLVAMAGMFAVPFGMLAEFGMGSAVVQMRDLPEDVIRQLQSAALLICFVFFAGLWFLSPWVAAFFGVPEVRWILFASGLVIPMVGLQTVPMARLRRALDYRRLAFLEAIELTSAAMITVTSAFLGASYWSPVIGNLTGRAVAICVLLSRVPAPFSIPKWSSIKAPLLFGWRVSINGFAQFVSVQIDSLLVAKRLGESALGSYRMAWDFASGPAEKVSSLLMRASGPLFAGLDRDAARMQRYYLKIAEALCLGVFPVLTGLALVAPDAVVFVVGEKWRAAIVPMQFLALSRIIATLNILTNQALVSLHETRFVMYTGMAKLGVLAVSIYFAAPHGIGAVAAVWMAVTPVEHFLNAGRLMKLTALPFRDYLRALSPALLSCAFMAVTVLGIGQLAVVNDQALAVRLAIQVITGAVAYVGLLVIFWRGRLLAYLDFAKSLRKG